MSGVKTTTDASLPSEEQNHRLQKIIFTLLCIVIVAAPLPLGSARPLAWNILELSVALLLLLSIFIATRENMVGFQRVLLAPALLLFLLIGFILLQVSTNTPVAWHSPVWDQTTESLGRGVQGSIAVDRQAALIFLPRIVAYAGIFYLSLMLCRTPSRAHLATKIIILCGSAYALYGLLVEWSGSQTILWFPKWAYAGDVTATFVNRNSAATYFGLCMLTIVSQLIGTLVKTKLYGGWRQQFSIIVDFISARSWLLLCLFIVLTALVLTHSRAGLFSSLGGLAALIIAAALAPSLRVRQIGRIAVPVVILIVAFAVSGNLTAERLADLDLSNDGRFGVDEIILEAVRDYPISGIGWGSFASVFPIYRPASLVDYYDLAHNDYLQNLLELGIPATACLFALPLWLFAFCARGAYVRQRDAIIPCLGIAATVLVGVHSFFDFSLQIPAVTATYMFLMGLAVAQSRSSRE